MPVWKLIFRPQHSAVDFLTGVYDSTTGQLCYRHTNYDMGAGREVRALAFSDEPGLTFAAGGIDHQGEVEALCGNQNSTVPSC